MSSEYEDDWAHNDEVSTAPAKPTLAEPSKYQVLMLNDDYTPMDFVIEVLKNMFSMADGMATQTMMEVHTAGRARCGIYSFEVAESKVEQANSYAQQHGHPLQCTLEEI
jgi:ATP-dependent Clp protease adaptor protein ClpS